MKHIYFGLMHGIGWVASEGPYLVWPKDASETAVSFETYDDASKYRARKIADFKKQGGDEEDGPHLDSVYFLTKEEWQRIERFVKASANEAT